MPQLDPHSLVRIAIALAALKHKPSGQSTASYLLDLQSRFPAAAKDDDAREWRTYALELEKQLATLKAQHDADQELLSKLHTDASQAAGSDAPPPKKRSKKNPSRDRHDLEWNWDQSRADWSRALSSQYPSSPSLVTAYASLRGALASSNTDLPSYASRLTDAILRALDAVYVFLFSAPTPSLDAQTRSTFGAPLQLKPEHIDSTRIALASPLLKYVLRTALHTLVRIVQDSIKLKRQRPRLRASASASADVLAHIDKVIDRLLECVLLVLLRAVAPLCSARLAPLLSASLKKDKAKAKDRRAVDPPDKTDVRTDVFALIGTSLEALDALPPIDRLPGGSNSIAGGIRDRLGLETIRELEALYAVPPPVPSGSCPPSSEQPPAPSLPTPTPTPLSAPSQTQIQTCSRTQSQPRTQHRAATRSHAKQRLEKLAGTRAERVRALATRDAGWFLVSTLGLCVAPSGAHNRAAENPGTAMLREALLDRIGKLVRAVPLDGQVCDCGSGQRQSSGDDAPDEDVHRCADSNATDPGPKLAIDPVCRNMLLAICERALSQLALPQDSTV